MKTSFSQPMTLLSGIKPPIADRIRRDLRWCLLAGNHCLNRCSYDLAFIKRFCRSARSGASFPFGVHSWLSSFSSIFTASVVLLAFSLHSFLLLGRYFWTALGIVSSQSPKFFVGWVGSVATETYFYNSASIPLSEPLLTVCKHTWLLPQARPSSLPSQSSLSLWHRVICLPGQKPSLISACG